ncbi:MAG: GntR family transcriptional regulator [Victivallales bacterium]|nr:GntR family transcriptional regulator [Victivallales bacterium]
MSIQWNYKEIALDREKSLPLYLQLAAELRRLIGGKHGKPNGMDGRMPSVRQLARLLDVDRTTVSKAYQELLSQNVFRRSSLRVLSVSTEAHRQLNPFPNIGIILPCPFSVMADAHGGFPLLYLKGVIDTAAKKSISTIMVQLPPPDAGYQVVEPFLDELEGRLLGVIHIGGRACAKDIPLTRLMQRKNIPQVMLSAYPALKHIACVTADVRGGADALAEQLLAFGHRHVGIMHFLTGEQPVRDGLLTYESHLRTAKFESAFQAHGLLCHRKYHCRGCSSYPATIRALERKKTHGGVADRLLVHQR